ncbi:MAG: sulfatase [Kiritimatiellales bacterium]|nr:sulfatase [Kiritimatiellales bacterium]
MTTGQRIKRYILGAFALAAMGSVVQAATIAYRLGSDAAGLIDYKNNPDSFPVCKSGTTYMHYDGTPPLASGHLFDTEKALIEVGMYTVGGQYTGTDVVNRIRTYEGKGWDVSGVFLYREDWLNGAPIGEYPVDWRILSSNEIATIQTAIATANPPLLCKDTVQLFQLLGSGTAPGETVGHAANFPIMDAAVKEHLKLFDGVGLECHIGDDVDGFTQNNVLRQNVLSAMAGIVKWTGDNGKQALVFMGGGPPSYENLPNSQRTYHYLWSEILAAGTPSYRSDHIIYFRQGARAGNHVPESAIDTLTHQQKWVIQALATNGTSLFVGDVADQSMVQDTAATVPFAIGKVETPASGLATRAFSSNPALVSNANLYITGSSEDRILHVTPNPLQTGAATISLVVDDGATAITNAFLLTVTPYNAVAQSALRWHWNVNGDSEGWTATHMVQVAVTNGVLSGVVDNDPYVSSPDNLGLDLGGVSNVYIRARNGSVLTGGAVYFQTTSSPGFVGNLVGFTAIANDPDFTTYVVNMSTHSNWTGTLKRLRVDLPNGDSPGSVVAFDWVAIGQSGLRPNVVFVMADDLGWNDTSINGSTFYHTPSLERLAQRGVRLTQAYTANPLCSPTRASILTGRYPGRLRFTTPAGHLEQVILDPIVPATAASTAKLREPQSCTRLDNAYVTYAETMKTVGYATAFMGKWHLGRDPYIPENQGFDTVVGGRYHSGPPGGYFAPFSADSNLPAAPAGTHVNDVLAASAEDFIDAERNKPFLLNLWFYDVHAPFECKQDLRSKYVGQASADGRQKNPTMGAMVESMDTGLGQVLDRIDALGLADNTVIVFFSDNGGNMYNFTDGALPTHNWPLRHGKASMYEGGTRVPCVVVWPGHTAAGSTSDGFLQSPDFYPTILSMGGLEAEPGTALDAFDQTALLQGGASSRTNLFCHFPHSTPATGTFAGCWVRQDDWKLIRYFHDGPANAHRYELYNLVSDPHEETDVAESNPAIVAQLDALISDHLAETAALVPVPNAAYAPKDYGWLPNVQARLSDGSTGKMMVTANGFVPRIESKTGLARLGTPARAAVRMQSRSFGDGKLFWKLQGQTAFSPGQSVPFPVVHDDTVHTYEIPFSPGAPVEQIAIQPSSDVSATEIESIELRDAAGKSLKAWGWLDSDGDGTSDAAETAVGRNPANVSDMAFHFETDGDFEGWTDSPKNIDGLVVSNGVVKGTALTGDPFFANYAVGFPSLDVPSVTVRLRAGANAGVQFYWAPVGGAFSASTHLDRSYTGSGNWQVLEYVLAGNAQWDAKTIDKIRIDPIGSATWFEIDWIRAANGDADNDGFPDWAENIVGTGRLDPADDSFQISSGEVPVQVNGKAGRLYSLQRTDSLLPTGWSTVETAGPLASDQTIVFTNGTPSTNGFYRVLVELP